MGSWQGQLGERERLQQRGGWAGAVQVWRGRVLVSSCAIVWDTIGTAAAAFPGENTSIEKRYHENGGQQRVACSKRAATVNNETTRTGQEQDEKGMGSGVASGVRNTRGDGWRVHVLRGRLCSQIRRGYSPWRRRAARASYAFLSANVWRSWREIRCARKHSSLPRCVSSTSAM